MTAVSTVRVVLGSKAETLERLAPRLKSARVLEQQRVSVAEWRSDRTSALSRIAAKFNGRFPVIVRSSSSAEDRVGRSLAGHFLSIGNVATNEVASAIEKVIASFGPDASPRDQVFVQQMVQPRVSGVAFTRDPNTGAPYIVVNYEDEGDHAAVTGGHGANLKTFVLWKGGAECPEALRPVVALSSELEELLGSDSLDIEFGIDSRSTLFLFQVRPLTLHVDPIDAATHKTLLEAIADKIAQANRPHPYLRGRRTLYGIMPDWNPAEMIGVRPRPLALSLYRQLITDSVWAYQRNNYGYRNLRSFPLMLSFCGLPYIDVRVSFNSFVPGDVSEELADRLVDTYIDQLAAAPILHDKVEFEIVFSCYTFDLEQRLKRLTAEGFSEQDLDELTGALKRLTNRIVHREAGLWRTDSEKIQVLKERQKVVHATDMDLVSRIYWLIEDCKRWGTLPFAGLARAGFVAVQMLKSLVAVGALEHRQSENFLSSLETISARMMRDFKSLSRGGFLAEYGHLRPGTYDIRSPRYDEAPDRYFGTDWSQSSVVASAIAPFAPSASQMRTIDRLLQSHGLEMDANGLFDFLRAGINGREQAKFVFSRSLSDTLVLLAKLGERYGIDREEMSYFDAALIAELYTSSGNIEEALRDSIRRGRERYRDAQGIVLPPLISQPDEVWAFHVPPSEPNFITQRTAEGVVRNHEASPESLKGAIVVIPSADPGFDWIFSHGIAGFITAYGGVNSHMAIRAGELKLPAVIGAGETLYNKWRSARRLFLDCATRRVEILG